MIVSALSESSTDWSVLWRFNSKCDWDLLLFALKLTIVLCFGQQALKSLSALLHASQCVNQVETTYYVFLSFPRWCIESQSLHKALRSGAKLVWLPNFDMTWRVAHHRWLGAINWSRNIVGGCYRLIWLNYHYNLVHVPLRTSYASAQVCITDQ